MPLVACEECGHEISASANVCPSCGASLRATCPRCGARAVQKVDGLRGFSEDMAGLILLALAILPGIAYYFDRTRLPYCTSCHRRVPKT
jgi:predicted RNA-binding Zn-ribbon protein involved in translation (DUF1610 family)